MKWPRDFFCRSIWIATNIDPQSAPEGEAGGAREGSQSPENVVEVSRRGFVGLIRRHKIATVIAVILVLLLVELSTIPWFSIADLRTKNPGITAIMEQRLREAEDAGKTLRVRHQWVSLNSLPRHLIDAVVVAEDGTFYTHGGIDWFEVQESIEKDVAERRVARGASTITQQLAKNLYLSTSRDPVRKLKELLITLLLERELTKDRILELYLNVIEWGPGVFGVQAAAETYFGKPASALTLDESLRLAAVIPSPLRHRPDADSRYVLRRSQIMLDRLEARHMIVQQQSEDTTARQEQDTIRAHPEAIPRDSTETDEGDSNGL